MMNRFFTLFFAASCVTAVGQVDYNPDANGDGAIGSADLVTFLSYYGLELDVNSAVIALTSQLDSIGLHPTSFPYELGAICDSTIILICDEDTCVTEYECQYFLEVLSVPDSVDIVLNDDGVPSYLSLDDSERDCLVYSSRFLYGNSYDELPDSLVFCESNKHLTKAVFLNNEWWLH